MEQVQKARCIGGWAFLLVALGIFLLLPGTIMTGIYAADNVSERTAALTIFCVGLVFLLIGSVLSIVWCRTDTGDDDKDKLTDEEKASGKKSKDNKPPPSNGTAKYVRSPSPEDVGERGPGDGVEEGTEGREDPSPSRHSRPSSRPNSRPKSVGAATIAGVAIHARDGSTSSSQGSTSDCRGGSSMSRGSLQPPLP